MKHSLLCAALLLAVNVSANAQNAAVGSPTRQIRLNDAYIRASCALAKAAPSLPDIKDVSPEKLQEAFARRIKLEE